jgi:hypothetical protein
MEGICGEAVFIFLVDYSKPRWHGVVEACVGLGLMVSCRVEAQSDIVVTPTAGNTKIILIFIPRIARWFKGGDGFCSERMRCSQEPTIQDVRSRFA